MLIQCTPLLVEKGRCRTRGESEESVVCRQGSTQVRESTLALKPRAYFTRSPKQGYQWPHKKDLCPTKFIKKKGKSQKPQLLNSIQTRRICQDKNKFEDGELDLN